MAGYRLEPWKTACDDEQHEQNLFEIVSLKKLGIINMKNPKRRKSKKNLFNEKVGQSLIKLKRFRATNNEKSLPQRIQLQQNITQVKFYKEEEEGQTESKTIFQRSVKIKSAKNPSSQKLIGFGFGQSENNLHARRKNMSQSRSILKNNSQNNSPRHSRIILDKRKSSHHQNLLSIDIPGSKINTKRFIEEKSMATIARREQKQNSMSNKQLSIERKIFLMKSGMAGRTTNKEKMFNKGDFALMKDKESSRKLKNLIGQIHEHKITPQESSKNE